MLKLPEMIIDERRLSYMFGAPNTERDMAITKELLLGKSPKEVGAMYSITRERCAQILRSMIRSIRRVFQQSVYQAAFPISLYPEMWSTYSGEEPIFKGLGCYFKDIKPHTEFLLAALDALQHRLGFKQKRIISNHHAIYESRTISDDLGEVASIYIRSVPHDLVDDLETYEHVMKSTSQGSQITLYIEVDVDSMRTFKAPSVQDDLLMQELKKVLTEFGTQYHVEWSDETIIDIKDVIQSGLRGEDPHYPFYTAQVLVTDEALHADVIMRKMCERGLTAVFELMPKTDYVLGICAKTIDDEPVMLDRDFVHTELRYQLSEVINLQQLYGNPGSDILFYEYGLQQLAYHLCRTMNDEMFYHTVNIELFQCEDLWILRTAFNIADNRKVKYETREPIILGQLQL